MGTPCSRPRRRAPGPHGTASVPRRQPVRCECTVPTRGEPSSPWSLSSDPTPRSPCDSARLTLRCTAHLLRAGARQAQPVAFERSPQQYCPQTPCLRPRPRPRYRGERVRDNKPTAALVTRIDTRELLLGRKRVILRDLALGSSVSRRACVIRTVREMTRPLRTTGWASELGGRDPRPSTLCAQTPPSSRGEGPW